MKIRNLFWAVAAIILLPLVGCQTNGNTTAEQAAARQVLKSLSSGETVDPTSIEALQSQEFEGSTYVVLSYKRMWNNRDEKCLAVYETHQEVFSGWVAGSGGGACSERQVNGSNPSDPMSVSGGTTFRRDQNKPDISHVLGRINDPTIVKVRIVWQDGKSQEAPVINQSFVFLRTGKLELKTAEGFDSANTVVSLIGR